jgi:hypothetical protein
MGALTIGVVEEAVTETIPDEVGAEVGVEAVATGLTGAWGQRCTKNKKAPHKGAYNSTHVRTYES